MSFKKPTTTHEFIYKIKPKRRLLVVM